jgi:SpoVK/Ycf46/Vps4 family AAA+-type ATPase
LNGIPAHLPLPGIPVPEFSFHERTALWKRLLGARAKGLDAAVNECSRRFRYEKESIYKIGESINALPGTITAEDFVAACRAHLESDLGDLAQKVTPRFNEETLILPHKQHVQFREVARAMKSLTEVHYNWGTARAWNESGISVLFAGSPGTGKTMAAEVLARELDLPIYRIDLSQVVNKYIGETEKNLKRLFDAADISDMILFFDEADSLFGRRTEVKDAHDRYANLEISYLLERMERFKGMAILATNRKKDLDEAFLRRLRYIVEFPFPEIEERKRIWRQVIPGAVDYSGVDINFLARKFQLTGGHIRSAVLNACLQCAAGAGAAKVLNMEQMIIAVKREYDKMERSVGPEYFGPYAGLIEKIEKNVKE